MRWRDKIVLVLLAGGLFLACSDDGTTASSQPDTPEATTAATTEDTGSSDTTSATVAETPDDTAQTLRIVNPEEPPSLDFALQTGAVLPQLFLYNTMETLVQLDDNGEIQPLLADTWEVSADGLTYTFNIHEGVTFHDGSPLTTEDVVFTILHARDTEAHISSAAFANVASAEATGANTVEVMLASPDSGFLKNMAKRPGVIMAERHQADMASHIVGTGPFAFAEWNRGESLVVERYEDYWGEAPALDRVEWVFINDENAAINALLAGDVDAISEVNAFSRAQDLEASEDVTVVPVGADNVSILSINHEAPPFDNLRIRQALSHAIDEQAILDSWGAGYGEAIGVMASLQDPFLDEYDPYPYDPEAARAILQEEGQEGLEVVVSAISDGISQPQGEIIMAQMFDAGFSPTMETFDLATGLDTIVSRADYQISPIGVKAERIHRMTCAGDWFQNYCNPEYDALLEEAILATDPDEITEAYRTAVHFLADDVATIPFIARVNVGAHRNNVSGWRQSNPEGVMDLRPLQIAP